MSSKPKESRRYLPTALPATAIFDINKLNESRELDRKQLEQRIARSGGQLEFLRLEYPLLARSASGALSDGTLTRYTSHDLKDAESRLQGCATCPSEGGKCARDHRGHAPGIQPKWETGQLVFSVCDRWPEYEIRTRICGGGVPKRIASAAITDLWQDLTKSAQATLKGFRNRFENGQFTSLLVSGARSTLVCVAALRAVVTERNDLSFRFTRCPELQRTLKAYFADPHKTQDPFTELADADVLVLSELNLETAPPWFADAVKEVVYPRFLREKMTIVGVHSDAKEAAKHFEFDESVLVCAAGN